MRNERWRGTTSGQSSRGQPTNRTKTALFWFVALLTVLGFTSITVYVHNLPDTQSDTPHRRHLKRGELGRKHNEYMHQQALFPHKSYFFKRRDFEPRFSSVTTLQQTCHDRCAPEACEHIHRSTLHSPCCGTNVTHETWIFPLLITATPRSGTVATLNLFRALGLQLGDDWDKPGKDGRISWIHGFNEYDNVQIPGNHKAMAYYGQPHKLLVGDRFRVIIHLVRDPLSSITSIACTEPLADIQWSEFVRSHIRMERWGKWGQRNDFLIAMQMWLDWHHFLDDICVFRMRLEDLFSADKSVDIVRDVFTLIDLPTPTPSQVQAALREVEGGKKKNQRGHRPKVTWGELLRVSSELTHRVRERSCQYGYFCDVDLVSIEQETQGEAISSPVCEFEADTDRGWSPGMVSALPPELQPK